LILSGLHGLPSHRVTAIDARLKAGQLAACPNPSPKAERRTDRKRQKNLCVVFHAVLQYIQQLQDVIVCALAAIVYMHRQQEVNLRFAEFRQCFVPTHGNNYVFLHFPNPSSLIFKGTLGTNRENELYFCHIPCPAF